LEHDKITETIRQRETKTDIGDELCILTITR